jgi:hypothetical protein
MADKENPQQVLEMYFPFKGFDKSTASKDPIPLTSPFLLNVRVRDVSENRIRGGQRPGLKKAFTTQAGEDRPVIKMVSCTNTYIPPA